MYDVVMVCSMIYSDIVRYTYTHMIDAKISEVDCVMHNL